MAVVGMAVPFGGRPKQPAIGIMQQLYAGRFHYILHFQQPGVAEAEMDADIPRTLRMMMHNTSAAVPKDHFLQEKTAGAGLFDGMQDPGTLPVWCDAPAFALYVQTFQERGFYGALNWYRNFERNWQRSEFLAGAQVTQPTLFLIGDQDPVGVLEAHTLKRMPDSVPHLDTRVLADCGHWIQSEQGDEVNRHLLAFLGSVDNPIVHIRCRIHALLTGLRSRFLANKHGELGRLGHSRSRHRCCLACWKRTSGCRAWSISIR